MLRLLFIISLSLLFQACQVDEKTTSSNQKGSILFPGATFTTVLPADGWKKLGDHMDITLIFPLPVSVSGMPYIEAKIGSAIRRFYYFSGSNTETLIFRYTVSVSDLDTDGIEIQDVIKLNGASLTYSPQNAITDNVPLSLSIYEHLIKVDGEIPYLLQTTAPSPGGYATNNFLSYHLTYSEKVFVSGLPSFDIALNSGTVPANYRSGSGSKTLQFARKIQASDTDADGFTNGTIMNLNPGAGITITDQAGNAVPGFVYPAPTTSIFINIIQPTITSVTPPAAATYTAGQHLDFVVTMSEPVDVVGAPSIPITINSGTVNAYYLSGTGTASLIFRYTVGINQVDPDGIVLNSPMLLNSGTIKNLAGTQYAALVYTIPSTVGRLIDSAVGPYVLYGNAPNAGTYIESVNLDFKLNFNKVVTVGGVPRLPLIIGTTTVYADYLAGSGTNSLTFRYTTTVADQDVDGITLNGPIDLNGGSIIDSALKPAILSYIPPVTNNIFVDGTTPSVTSVSSSNTGTVTQGHQVNFTVTFSENVTVIGSPILDIDVGGVTKAANYISGSGTDSLLFRYIIQSGDNDSNGIDVNTLSLNGGIIRDANAHNANLTFVSFNLPSLLVDASGPVITSITPPTDGNYKIGDVLEFTINWSENTYVSGLPRLALTVGAQTLYATYASVPSTSLSAVFRYTVQTNHLDADGIATAGLQLNGGQIKDSAGNAANLAFAAPNLSNVLIDGVVPFVSSITPPANMTYRAGQDINFSLTWSENVTFTGTPSLSLVIGTTPVSASLSASGANSAVFTYTVLSGQLDTNGIDLLSAIALGAGVSIKDQAGNDSYLQINAPVLTSVKVDAIVPTVSGIIPPAAETYKRYDYLDFEVIWSEAVTVSGNPQIQMLVGATTVYATYLSGSGTTSTIFRYQVANGHIDTDGINIYSPIQLNLGTITDAALNDATLTFVVPSLTDVLVDGVIASINPLNPLTPPVNGTYALGSNLDFTVHWTEPVVVDTTGGTPAILIRVGSTYRYAIYSSGSGSTDLIFRYSLTSGELDNDGVDVYRMFVFLNGGSIKDLATNNASVSLVSNAFVNFSGVKVDAAPPTVISATSTNLTTVSHPNYFRPGNLVQYTLYFNETVTITGVPRIQLNIGGTVRYANYHSGSGSSTLSFRFTVDAGDVLLDLDGISVNTSIDMNGGSIKDAYANDLATAFPFSEKDYVYYTAIVARYHVSGNDYTSSSCGINFCATSVKDISGNNNHLFPANAQGPIVATGFGSNSTGYLQFSNTAYLATINTMNVKQTILAMKTVSNPSNTAFTSFHPVLNRRYFTNQWYWNGWNWQYGPVYHFDPTIRHTSNSTTKAILMSPNQKLKINDGAFSTGYVNSESAPALWVPDTTYIFTHDYLVQSYYHSASEIGGNNFNGQIAEVIMLQQSASITETHLNNIRDQLNDIHGAY